MQLRVVGVCILIKMDRLEKTNFVSICEHCNFSSWNGSDFILFSHYFQSECWMLNQNHEFHCAIKTSKKVFGSFSLYLIWIFRCSRKWNNNYFVNNSSLWCFFMFSSMRNLLFFGRTIHIRPFVTLFNTIIWRICCHSLFWTNWVSQVCERYNLFA